MPDTNLRIGYGEDTHALDEGTPLVIGGVKISESTRGPQAHSDGDVLFHALADALLSTAALGDIGNYFPPSEAEFKDMNSKRIVEKVQELLLERQVRMVNMAAVITLDKPKLDPYRERIQVSLVDLLSLSSPRIGLSFKTSEGLAQGYIQARVTVLVQRSEE